MCSTKIFLAMIFNEIKRRVNTSLGLVGGMHPLHPSPVSAPVNWLEFSAAFIDAELCLFFENASFPWSRSVLWLSCRWAFIVLSLYFVVIKLQSWAACFIVLLPCVGGFCPRQHIIFFCSLYFNCYGLRAWMSTTLSYRFYVPTDKSFRYVGVYRV